MANDSEFMGPSKYKIAKDMAVDILISIEGKSWAKLTRQEYLETVFECMQVLEGVEP